MPRPDTALNASERRAVACLASIFALRMLGLFLILPVLSVFVRELPDATPALAGLALGIYGLTQGLLQIPFGYLSDRFGRKRIITVGLVIFALGSVVAAMSTTIGGVIAGRALQGAGAIAAAVLALTADLTREQQRTKAMAMIGGSIGASFLLALMLAPLLVGMVGVSGIFWITAALPLAMLPILWWATPNPARHRRGDVAFDVARIRRILLDPQLWRLDLGIFALHFALTALFVVVPLKLVDSIGLPGEAHWKIYVPVLVASVAGMLPILVAAHRGHRYRGMLMLAIAVMVLAEVVFAWLPASLSGIVIALWLFFVGFNALEAMLPSLVSRLSPAGAKGTVLGVYNSFEFAGIFAGGLVGGLVYGAFGVGGAALVSALVLVAWLALVATAPNFRLLDSVTYAWPGAGGKDEADALLAALTDVPGVEDVTALPDEGMVYLKVDRAVFDPRSIDAFPALAQPG